MAYSKQNWNPDEQGTPKYITPSKMNHIEQGIYDSSVETDKIPVIETNVSNLQSQLGEVKTNADKVPQLRTDVDELTTNVNTLNSAIGTVDTSIADLKFLGWTVPKEMTLKNYVDSNGAFHQRVGRVDLGSLNYDRFQQSSIYLFDTTNSSFKATNNALCSELSITSQSVGWNNLADKSVRFGDGRIRIRYDAYTDASAFKSAMKGIYLYYELATEVVISEGKEAVAELAKGLKIGRKYSEGVVVRTGDWITVADLREVIGNDFVGVCVVNVCLAMNTNYTGTFQIALNQRDSMYQDNRYYNDQWFRHNTTFIFEVTKDMTSIPILCYHSSGNTLTCDMQITVAHI